MFDPLGYASINLLLGEKCTHSINDSCGCWCADGSTVSVSHSGGILEHKCPSPASSTVK